MYWTPHRRDLYSRVSPSKVTSSEADVATGTPQQREFPQKTRGLQDAGHLQSCSYALKIFTNDCRGKNMCRQEILCRAFLGAADLTPLPFGEG